MTISESEPTTPLRFLFRWLRAVLIASAVVAGACSSVDSATSPERVIGTEAVTTTPPSGADDFAHGSGSATADDDPSGGQIGIVGAEGIGDPMFPELGNGGYQVEHYRLELDVDRPQLTGLATLTVIGHEPLDRFNLDLVGLSVDSVTVAGVAAEFSRRGRELTIDPIDVIAPDVPVDVVIAYGGIPAPIADPAGPAELGWYTEPWGTFVISEPSGAATWFPANDHPRDKATFEFIVTVPAGQTAVAAGILDERRTDPDGQTTFVWRMDDPMATYLASVVTGDITLVEEPPIGPTTIRHALPTDDADRLAGLAELQRPMMKLFVDIFGPYPFDNYGIAVVESDLGFLALENQTLSIFGAALFDTASGTLLAQRVMAHELAHQWFGNQVSPDVWDDIWLNEGFATWSEYYWMEQTFPERDVWRAPPIALGPLTGLEPEALFGPNVYIRGGLTLEALRRHMGDEPFFGLLRTWVTRHAGGTASTDDFLALVEETAGPQALTLMESWIFDEQMPRLADR